jgi:hypothetical protein
MFLENNIITVSSKKTKIKKVGKLNHLTFLKELREEFQGKIIEYQYFGKPKDLKVKSGFISSISEVKVRNGKQQPYEKIKQTCTICKNIYFYSAKELLNGYYIFKIKDTNYSQKINIRKGENDLAKENNRESKKKKTSEKNKIQKRKISKPQIQNNLINNNNKKDEINEESKKNHEENFDSCFSFNFNEGKIFYKIFRFSKRKYF